MKRLSRRAKWDVIMTTAGFIYVVLILCLSLDTPLVSLLFVGLAVRQLCWRTDVQ